MLRALAALTLLAAGDPIRAGDAALPLDGEWCRTQEAWARKTKDAGGAAAGGCPLQGACDAPDVRDSYVPVESAPFKVIRVHLLVFRDSDGNDPAATKQDVIEQMARMNHDFAPSRIAFEYTWEYVDDSLFRYNGGHHDPQMKDLYAVAPQMQCNIFVISFNGGYGTFPWDPAALTAQGGIILGEAFFGGGVSVISHEMGHNLGLWHTHHGVFEVAQCSACYEWANGVNGETTGDFCGDTPSTPRNDTCLDPAGIDTCSEVPWGLTLPESYMSYGLPCWSLFSVQQRARMHCWLQSALTSWLACESSDADGDGVADGCCPGDADGSGSVDINDFLGLVAAWGTANPAYDIAPGNGDGTVDATDMAAMVAHWGPCR